jgi:hypothetical protein
VILLLGLLMPASRFARARLPVIGGLIGPSGAMLSDFANRQNWPNGDQVIVSDIELVALAVQLLCVVVWLLNGPRRPRTRVSAGRDR